jgi:hypothetical protein
MMHMRNNRRRRGPLIRLLDAFAACRRATTSRRPA